MPTSEGPSANREEAVVVRDAAADDLSDLLRLYQQLAQDRGSALPVGADDATPLLAAIATQPGRHLLVAEVGGKIVGTADLLMVPNLTHSGAPWAVVENVVVDKGVPGGSRSCIDR